MATVEERLAGLERGYEHMATKADVVALASEVRLLKWGVGLLFILNLAMLGRIFELI